MNLEETKFCSECKKCQEVVKKENGNYKVVCPHFKTSNSQEEDLIHEMLYCKFKENK